MHEATVAGERIESAKDVWMTCVDTMAIPDNVLVAINQEYADFDATVNDGDEVAFFPPVTGG